MKLMPISRQLVGIAIASSALVAACSSMQPTAPTSDATTATTTTPTTTAAPVTPAPAPTPEPTPTPTPTPAPNDQQFCATGDGVNDAGACNADAEVYCSGFYGPDWQAFARANGYTTASWKYGLVDCISKNPRSAACQASQERRDLLNAQMMDACGTYCRGTRPQPGAEPCVDQLKSLYTSLDSTCRAALDAHEGAKALDGQGKKCGL
jgi:hypothetical protein